MTVTSRDVLIFLGTIRDVLTGSTSPFLPRRQSSSSHHDICIPPHQKLLAREQVRSLTRSWEHESMVWPLARHMGQSHTELGQGSYTKRRGEVEARDLAEKKALHANPKKGPSHSPSGNFNVNREIRNQKCIDAPSQKALQSNFPLTLLIDQSMVPRHEKHDRAMCPFPPLVIMVISVIIVAVVYLCQDQQRTRQAMERCDFG
nr:hypothetical protein CFP56_08096 [Quercus suber]